jgi:predicted PurR-regulated permease PerM
MSVDPLPPTVPGRRTRRLRAPTPRAALVGATAVLLALLATQVIDVLTPFVLGLLLVYLLAPGVDRLSGARVGRRTMPRWVAILLLYLVIVVVVAIGVVLVVRPMSDQLQRFGDELPQMLDSLRAWYAGLQLPEWLRSTIDHVVGSDATGEDAGGPDLASLVPLARSLATTLVSTFGYLIIPVWAFYVLKDLARLQETFVHALPSAWRRDALAVVGIVDHTFGRWIRGQLFLGVVVGLATFVGLLILGALVDPVFLTFAVLLAVIAGFLELVPIIGPILSMIPTLVLSLTAQDPVKAALAVVLLYLVVQQVENHVLVPKIQGDAVELHPSIVILALIVGSALFGLLGAILAVPVTAAGRDIYRYLFRRLSEDDPDVPDPDAADLARKTGRTPRPADLATNAPAGDLPAVAGRRPSSDATTEAAAAW